MEKSRSYCNCRQTTSSLINTEVSKLIINDTGKAVKRCLYGGNSEGMCFPPFAELNAQVGT